MLSTLLSFQGRLGRRDFWIYYIGVSVAALVLLWLKNSILRGVLPASTGLQFIVLIGNALSLAILLPATLSIISLAVRRSRDVGINPWFLLIPVLNVLIFLACMFAPSGWRSRA